MLEGLSKIIGKAKKKKSFKVVKVSSIHFITHLLFVDDVILFGDGSLEDWETFYDTIKLLCEAFGMEVSDHNSNFLHNGI